MHFCSYTSTRSPKAPRSPNATYYATSEIRRNKTTECNSQWEATNFTTMSQYPHPTENLTTAKLHWDIVLFIPYGKYLIVDVNNFYLNNLTKKDEYYNI